MHAFEFPCGLSAQELACLSGIGGTKDIFPMKAFSNEYEPTHDIGILLFGGLQHALYAAEDYLEGVQMTKQQASGPPRKT